MKNITKIFATVFAAFALAAAPACTNLDEHIYSSLSPDNLSGTDDEVQDLIVKQYHQQMLEMSRDKLSELASQDRDFSALTFSIRRKDFPNLKKQIQLMRKELLDFSADAGEGDDVVQVNIQLFPLTRGM